MRTWQALTARRGLDPAATELDLVDLELELNLFRALSPTQALGAGVVVYAEGRDMAERSAQLHGVLPRRIVRQMRPLPHSARTSSPRSARTWSRARSRPTAGTTSWCRSSREMGKAIELSSICGLGRSVPVPLLTTISFFERHRAVPQVGI